MKNSKELIAMLTGLLGAIASLGMAIAAIISAMK